MIGGIKLAFGSGLDELGMSQCAHYVFKIPEVIVEKVSDPDQAFLLSCEHQGRHRVIRHYHCFANYQQFARNRARYPHCHELLTTTHRDAKINPGGRLVFDFDIPNSVALTERFPTRVEQIVTRVLSRYYSEVDFDMIEFVWSSSPNPEKISKHLTAKHCYFLDWQPQIRQFYQLFEYAWERAGYEPDTKEFLDIGITRTNGTLRMVGSSKLGKSVLSLDAPDRFTLEDSLVRIYQADSLEQEQKIDPQSLNRRGKKILRRLAPKPKERHEIVTRGITWSDGPAIYPKWVYRKAFQLVNREQPGCFQPGKPTDTSLRLIRAQPSECLLSGKTHHSDNASLLIAVQMDQYRIWYHCFRNCARSKLLGVISEDSDG